ncbi:LysE family transporter [Alphaproteobacteria bacterium]|jgi:L-lysine exporter family protein LysE/ArgO|nr:LysE family transporter [Alphaproteobacteria bacterium]MDB9825020.1 LysE family transporter [Alphaproteobacteria bacterium]
MDIFIFGFITGLSLILAIGAQNIFVIEQGLKKNNVFIVCLLCSLFDVFLIALGVFIFHHFLFFSNSLVILILNILLIFFLIFFIYQKALQTNSQYTYTKKSKDTVFQSVIKTFGFTFLNPHVYSDTVFFLGNFSKSMEISSKIIFGFGASTASFIFFFILGYGAKAVSSHINNTYAWKLINIFIIIFMTFIIFFIVYKEIYVVFFR